MRAKLERKEDFEKYRGKLAGQIVLLGEMREVKPHEEVEMQRYDDKRLEQIYLYQAAMRRGYERPPREEMIRRIQFRKDLVKFLTEEKVAAVIKPSSGDGGTIFVQGTQAYKKDEPLGVPSLVMSIEHYGRIMRLMERDVPVELEVEVKTKFYDDDPMAYNTVAEIPGTDKKDEIVMLGGHLDSWHSRDRRHRQRVRRGGRHGSGAHSEGAGREAAADHPHRAVERRGGGPAGLEGLRGAAHRRTPDAGQPKPERGRAALLHAARNRAGGDQGGVAQGVGLLQPGQRVGQNPRHLHPGKRGGAADFRVVAGAVPRPGRETVTMRMTGGTDHLSFDAVGVPGFQFIQDPLEYGSRTHHSNMDVYERAQKDDLMEAAVIMASFVYNAAMRDQMMPRKPFGADTKVIRAEEKPAGDKAATEKGGTKVKKAAKKE